MGDNAFIDVSLGNFPRRSVNVKLCQFAVFYFCNSTLVRINRIDKDFTTHLITPLFFDNIRESLSDILSGFRSAPFFSLILD
jgi:hypothetical protein